LPAQFYGVGFGIDRPDVRVHAKYGYNPCCISTNFQQVSLLFFDAELASNGWHDVDAGGFGTLGDVALELPEQ
jgi:hypothetical protein